MFLLQASHPGGNQHHVPLLPQVVRHMAQAQNFLDQGLWDLASAHAGLVLIAHDFGVSIRGDRLRREEEETSREALQAACEAWSQALDGHVRFHVVDEPNLADLRFVFRPDVRLGREAVAGLTSWSRKLHTDGTRVQSAVYRADISVRSRWLDRTSLPFDPVRQEIEHELGHVLGLDDNFQVDRIMGKLDLRQPVSNPAPEEASTLKELRSSAEKIRQIAESHLHQIH